MNEFDFDAFPFGREVELDPPAPRPVEPPRDEAAAAIAAERRRMEQEAEQSQEQLTIDGSAVRVGETEEKAIRAHLRALVYESRSGGGPHVVSLHQTKKGRAVLCICEAIRNLDRRPQGCWAMVDARAIFGIPAIGGPA